ncbi:zinc-binding dehydrogenase [Mucilaginibacter sp. BJC16-A38]|uniref:quinone oxidoreductase family protein n=1 Tax=Mucilaginibacter phenanthrenivorans TaxID=1234842 RepID=UPI0021584414|nr:zinc-binding dehydrogenase [Mucilaginibacter phenanthrenivorans]MCR8557353.1 zinc-binding dehydrogenase [Mucilaginibacter phenanthrenivorans]
MKAAILYQLGQSPKYGEIGEPVPQNNDQLLITVKAAAIKNVDKGRASGSHYSVQALEKPAVVGMDGVGVLEDGTRVYGFGAGGVIAEKALLNRSLTVKLPDSLDDVTAAALPNAVIGAAAALRFRANLQPGQVVVINGATGVTGMVAVQIAKYYGAAKVIATGRNQEQLDKLLQLGADEVISLKQTDAQVTDRLKQIHTETPISIVIDYTWGHPAELLLAALKGNGSTTHKVRFVTVGGMAGEEIILPSSILRSSDIEILGSGLGSIAAEDMQKIFSEVIPEMFQLAAEGKLKMDTITVALQEIEQAWNMDVAGGTRLVVVV